MSDIGHYEHQVGKLTNAILQIGRCADVVFPEVQELSVADALALAEEIMDELGHLHTMSREL